MKNITQGAIRAIPVPDLDRKTQDQMVHQMAGLVARIEAETEQLNKLKSLKSGISSDLLTGRVPQRMDNAAMTVATFLRKSHLSVRLIEHRAECD